MRNDAASASWLSELLDHTFRENDMKEKRWWGITYMNSGDVMADTIRETRQEAMKACCDNRFGYMTDPDDWRPEWRIWKRLGCKAVRVVVSPNA